jgi:dTDP-L-rhamnose 4-epimerase
MLALKSNAADYEVVNVGSGNVTTVKNVAETLAKLYGKDVQATITNTFRKGDVRHCFADISKIKKLLDYSPKVTFEQGMQELMKWSETQNSTDNVDEATEELKSKGLME